MDTRNVIAAISLSAAVIILYGLFFAPPNPDPKQITNNDQDKNNLQLSEAPKLSKILRIIKFLDQRQLIKLKGFFLKMKTLKVQFL